MSSFQLVYFIIAYKFIGLCIECLSQLKKRIEQGFRLFIRLLFLVIFLVLIVIVLTEAVIVLIAADFAFLFIRYSWTANLFLTYTLMLSDKLNLIFIFYRRLTPSVLVLLSEMIVTVYNPEKRLSGFLFICFLICTVILRVSAVTNGTLGRCDIFRKFCSNIGNSFPESFSLRLLFFENVRFGNGHKPFYLSQNILFFTVISSFQSQSTLF